MMWFTLEFDDKDELRRCVELLQARYGVTGELSATPLTNHRWELQVVSEKRLSETVLEKLPGKKAESAP